MTTVDTAVFVADQLGNNIALLTAYNGLQYTKARNRPGAFFLSVRPDLFNRFRGQLLQADNRIKIYRRPEGTAARREFVGLIRYAGIQKRGERSLYFIAGSSPMELLQRRVVDAREGTAQANKQGEADAVLKDVFAEQLGASVTDTDRDWSTYIDVETDLPAGTTPTVRVDASYGNVLDTMQDICEQSTELGTPLYFDIVDTSETGLEFQVFPQYRGVDRRSAQYTLYATAGQIDQVDYNYDRRWPNNIARAYALGQGSGAEELIGEYTDNAIANDSVFSLTEDTISSTNSTVQTLLNNAARRHVARAQQGIRADARVLNRPGSRYGVDWDFGDVFYISIDGRRSSVAVDSITIQAQPDGREVITPILEQIGTSNA